MTLSTIFEPALANRLCLTLLHSVWQVAVLALAAAILGQLLGRRSLRSSYWAHVVCLGLAIAFVPLTFWSTSNTAPSASLDRGGPAATTAAAPLPGAETVATAELDPSREKSVDAHGRRSAPHIDFATAAVDKLQLRWPYWTPWLLVAYGVGVFMMLLRLFHGLLYAERLRRTAKPVDDDMLNGLLLRLSQRWSFSSSPTLLESERIRVPQVVGLLKPAILVPVAFASDLSTTQLEMILAHEISHIRRNDLWVNLCQRLAEVALFFNPALWILSRRISVLREYCSDEDACRGAATSFADTRAHYAEALMLVVGRARPTAAGHVDLARLAAQGRSPSELRRRVARLLGEPLSEQALLSRDAIPILAATFLLVAAAPIFLGRHSEAVAAPEVAEKGPSAAAMRSGELSVVVAEHVLLLDGQEIVAWDDLTTLIKTLPQPGRKVHFWFTTGAQDSGRWDELSKNIWDLRQDVPLDGHSMGSLSPRSAPRYDRIRSTEDLIDDPAHEIVGVAVDQDGNPVADAEVVLIGPIAGSVAYKTYGITLEQGKVRNPLDHVITRSRADGSFQLHPDPTENCYVLVTHPKRGFGVFTSSQLRQGREIKLSDWAGLKCTVGAVKGRRQTVSLSTKLHNRAGWPTVSISQHWTDPTGDPADNTFRYEHIPPHYDTTMLRMFEAEEGVSYAIPGATVSLLAGDQRRIDLGPLSTAQAARLESIQ